MLKFFGSKTTSKADVIMAVAGALVASWKAVDTIKDYKSDHQNEENQK